MELEASNLARGWLGITRDNDVRVASRRYISTTTVLAVMKHVVDVSVLTVGWARNHRDRQF